MVRGVEFDCKRLNLNVNGGGAEGEKQPDLAVGSDGSA